MRPRPSRLTNADAGIVVVREDGRLGRPAAQPELPQHAVGEPAASPPYPSHDVSMSPARAVFASAVSRSIGIGKTIVELLFEPISSSVCR
jgi:hypothetical protein